ncbi:MAG: Lrp/AsnC family transcriptional regulator [Alphaproteobacteria bacterium]|nr:Lrp/AsnC family transcriptional regulator [Alphaproteobacteria bacterium]
MAISEEPALPPIELDRIDRHILDILQTDNQISNLELADRVGLSPPACSRRAARLRREGVIRKDVSIVDPRRAGKSLAAIVSIRLEVRRKEHLEAFAAKMLARDEVFQCYMVSGPIDFVLHVVVDDVAAYTRFAIEAFAEDDNLQSHESMFVLAQVKNETKIELMPA